MTFYAPAVPLVATKIRLKLNEEMQLSTRLYVIDIRVQIVVHQPAL